MSLPLANILQHIRDEIEYLQYSAEGLKKAEFLSDGTMKRAFVRSLEVIGEAAKQIPAQRRLQFSRET